MNSNSIRKLTLLEAIPHKNERLEMTGALLPLNLVVGVDHTIYLEGENKPLKRKICLIQETENGYNIYLENGSERQLWKKMPKNKNTIIEYSID